MAHYTKKNIRDYAITGFKNGRKVYLSQAFDTYTVTEYMGDRMLWQDLSEAETVAVNPTVIRLFGCDGNVEEIPLDLPSDRYDPHTCHLDLTKYTRSQGCSFPVAFSANTTGTKTIRRHDVHDVHIGESAWPLAELFPKDLHADSLLICLYERPRATRIDQDR